MNASKWLRSLFPKPRVFISYAREDAAVAEWLFEELNNTGFTVYLDTRGTLAGERFLTVIVDHLHRCDAVLALISEHASRASGRRETPLCARPAPHNPSDPHRIRPADPSPGAFELLQREVQYVALEKVEDRWIVLRAIGGFRVVQRRVYLRWARRAGGVLALAGLLAWGLHSGFSNLMREGERRASIHVLSAPRPCCGVTCWSSQIERFKDDAPLRSRLLAMADDRERPMHTRLNSRILAAALGSRPKRWYLESLAWSSSVFQSGELTDVTFRTGTITAVEFEDITFSGVAWNEGPGFTWEVPSFCAAISTEGNLRERQ